MRTSLRDISRLMLASVTALALALFAFGDNLAQAAAITVTTTADELNADGDCSLREAVQSANTDGAVDACAAGSGVDIIALSAGTYTLSIAGAGEDANATGDLDIKSAIGLTGAGAASTFIDGASLDRVFHVTSGGVAATSDVAIGNGSADSGGGIRNDGTLVLINTTVSGNTTTMGNGGGIYNAGSLNLYNSTVSDNRAFAGGGIWSAIGTTVGVIGSEVSRNSAAGLGGGLASIGTLTIDLSTVSENTGGGVGGGIGSFGPLSVTNSTLSNNMAGSGGGIFSSFASATITNSTIFLNLSTATAFAEGGGGILNSGSLTVTNSTIFENFSVHPGGGIQNSSQGVTTLSNTIVASRESGGNCGGSIIDEGGNLSWPDSSCPGVNQDPLLDPAGLRPNGGPNGTIALQPGSPAIDAAVAANCPPADQRLVSRPQGAGCDIGAFEREVPASTAPDADNDGFDDAVELSVGTDSRRACGNNAWPADVNNDTYSDMWDLVAFGGAFGETGPARYDVSPAGAPDGVVDTFDLVRVAGLFGQSCR